MKKDEARRWKRDLLLDVAALIVWAIVLCVFAEAADGAPDAMDTGTRTLVTIGAATVGTWLMRFICWLDKPVRRGGRHG